MVKIPNLFNQNPMVISQGVHTQGWGTMSASVAIDFAYIGDLFCPFDGCKVELHSNSDQGQQSYFSLILPGGSRIICVHGYPVRTGVFNKGEVVGKCRWHHWHLSLIVEGKLQCILDYMDRSIPMITASNLYGTSSHPDGLWSSYADKYLNIATSNVKPQPVLGTIVQIKAQAGDGISHLLKRAGRTDFADPEAWAEFAELNNGARNVFLGETYRISTVKLQKEQPVIEPTVIEPMSTKAENSVHVEKDVNETKPNEETDKNVLPVTLDIDTQELGKMIEKHVSQGRPFGISKKLISILSIAIAIVTQFAAMPEPVQKMEIQGYPLVLWSTALLSALEAVYLLVQMVVDKK